MKTVVAFLTLFGAAAILLMIFVAFVVLVPEPPAGLSEMDWWIALRDIIVGIAGLLACLIIGRERGIAEGTNDRS